MKRAWLKETLTQLERNSYLFTAKEACYINMTCQHNDEDDHGWRVYLEVGCLMTLPITSTLKFSSWSSHVEVLNQFSMIENESSIKQPGRFFLYSKRSNSSHLMHKTTHGNHPQLSHCCLEWSSLVGHNQLRLVGLPDEWGHNRSAQGLSW